LFASSFKKPSCAAPRRAGVCRGGADIKGKEAESQPIHNLSSHVRQSCVWTVILLFSLSVYIYVYFERNWDVLSKDYVL
jgi:hypothetical protein